MFRRMLLPFWRKLASVDVQSLVADDDFVEYTFEKSFSSLSAGWGKAPLPEDPMRAERITSGDFHSHPLARLLPRRLLL